MATSGPYLKEWKSRTDVSYMLTLMQKKNLQSDIYRTNSHNASNGATKTQFQYLLCTFWKEALRAASILSLYQFSWCWQEKTALWRLCRSCADYIAPSPFQIVQQLDRLLCQLNCTNLHEVMCSMTRAWSCLNCQCRQFPVVARNI